MEQPQGPAPAPPARDGGAPLMSLISAALFLYVGFGLGLRGVSSQPVYDGSVTLLVWMARVVGIGLLCVAALEFAGVRGAALFDALLAGIAAVVCLGVGGVWIAYADSQGWLLFIFALVNASAARSAWQRSGLSSPADGG